MCRLASATGAMGPRHVATLHAKRFVGGLVRGVTRGQHKSIVRANLHGHSYGYILNIGYICHPSTGCGPKLQQTNSGVFFYTVQSTVLIVHCFPSRLVSLHSRSISLLSLSLSHCLILVLTTSAPPPPTVFRPVTPSATRLAQDVKRYKRTHYGIDSLETLSTL